MERDEAGPQGPPSSDSAVTAWLGAVDHEAVPRCPGAPVPPRLESAPNELSFAAGS